MGLNRAIALGNAEGPERGLSELERIPGADKLESYPFYPAAQGEFHRLAGRPEEARPYFERALELARNPAEARFLKGKLASCSN